MDNIKLSLTVLLPGSTMVSTEESVKQLKKAYKTKKGKTYYKTVLVPDWDKHDSFTIKVTEGGREVPIEVFIRKTKSAKQVINMTQEAYDYYISAESPIGFLGGAKAWNKLTRDQKLKWHCINIAKQVGGYVSNIQVLD